MTAGAHNPVTTIKALGISLDSPRLDFFIGDDGGVLLHILAGEVTRWRDT